MKMRSTADARAATIPTAWCAKATVPLILLALLAAGPLFSPRGFCDEYETEEGITHVQALGGAPAYDHPFYFPYFGYRFHPYYALVDCDVDPEEAAVILDGERLGEADDFDGFPSYLLVQPGPHRLEFHAPGHEVLAIEGEFYTGTFIRVNRELMSGGGVKVIRLQMPRRIDESGAMPAGEPTSWPDDRSGEPPGDGAATAGEFASPTAAGAGPDAEGEIDLPPVPAGLIKLSVSPGDASVYIDDSFFGSGEEVSRLHGFIRLAPGEHTIGVARPGYRSQTLTVTVAEGEKQYLDVWLEAERPD